MTFKNNNFFSCLYFQNKGTQTNWLRLGHDHGFTEKNYFLKTVPTAACLPHT